MEKNTINLSVKDYNEMRDFNEAVKKGNTVRIFWLGNAYPIEYYTTDEIVKEIAKINNELKDEIDKLKHPKKKQPSLDELRKMSWWQFRKWKRGI